MCVCVCVCVCLLRVLCTVGRPVTTLDYILLKDNAAVCAGTH